MFAMVREGAMSLNGGIAVVTGAASGIGRAIASGLAEDGATVAAADVNLQGAEDTAATIRETTGGAQAFRVDVTDPASVDALHAEVRRTLGVASVIVNAAGWDQTQPFLENERPFIEKVVQINYLGPVTLTQVFLRDMVAEGGGGRVVNIASDAGRVGSSGETVYAGAKGGVIAFTKSVAREMARYGITANCVCPGPTDTPLFHQQSEKLKEALIRAIPFKRLARPEEVAHAVRFFASPGAAYITGQVISVSGGLTMGG